MRAGASPEVVAAETGWPLDKVTRYAEPLLGERAYVAEQAARVEISRSRGGATLHESVCARLQVDPDTTLVSWDSYRSPEGRWVVTAFHDGGAVGTWVFDEVGHTVHPEDESARALMGGGPTIVTEEVSTQATEPSETVVTAGEPEGQPESSPEQTPAAPRPHLVSVTSDPTATDESTSDQQELISESEVPEAPPVARREKRSKGKRGRASVPSWDEILFGASKQTD